MRLSFDVSQRNALPRQRALTSQRVTALMRFASKEMIYTSVLLYCAPRPCAFDQQAIFFAVDETNEMMTQ